MSSTQIKFYYQHKLVYECDASYEEEPCKVSNMLTCQVTAKKSTEKFTTDFIEIFNYKVRSYWYRLVEPRVITEDDKDITLSYSRSTNSLAFIMED